MLYGLAAIAVVVAGFAAGIIWRIKTGVFCEQCRRPAHKCSCIEDGFVKPGPVINGEYIEQPIAKRPEPTIPTDLNAVVEQTIKARKKPFDS